MGSMSIKRCLGLSLVLLTLAGLSCGNFPLLDVDTNMRIVLVPSDTPVGGIIYRLRASDSDNNFPLSFEVLGALGKSLLDLHFLGCVESESLCQADVVLKKSLDVGRNYEFQLQVKDTNGDYTKVHAAITATSATANFNPLFGPRIIHLDENSKEGTILDKFEVLKNELNSRVVLLEVRDKGDRIGLKQRLVSNNRTEGTLFLKKKLDFETQPWFTFQLLAMNGWTNTSIDTRNILVSDVIIAVHDVQDTPPFFTLLPSSVELNSSIKTGDLVVKVEAVDGDKQNKRLIRYGFLTDSNPFVPFFDLDPMTGEIRLRRNITELLGIAKPNEPIKMTIIAEEIITDTARSGRSVGTALDRTMGNITFWFGRGSSFGPPIFSSDKFVGEIKENSLPGSLVQFGSGIGVSVSHQNPAEIISLSFSTGPSSGGIYKGNAAAINNINELLRTFQIIPSQGSGNFSFEIRVLDSTQLDYEVHHEIKLMIMGSTSSGMFSEVELTVHLRDENDNSPLFTQQEYRVELAEHSPIGTKVVQLKALDKDTTGNFGEVIYSNLIGSDAFRLDPHTGEITVDKPELLDRELEPEIRLYVEAKDGGHTEFTDPNLIRNIGTATIIVKLHDKNDNKPEFVQKYYQAVLNPEFTAFKNPVFVKAFDGDEGANGQVKYQSQDSKFFVDPTSGEVRLRGSYQRNPSDGDGPYLGSFKIRAYDLGNPQQSSETIIQLFSEEMVIREIQFVFPSTPDKIRRNQTSIEKMLSSLTGGIVGIQNVTPLSSRSSFVQNPATSNNNGNIRSENSAGNSEGSNNNGGGGRSLAGSTTSDTEVTERAPFLTSRSLDENNNKKAEGLSSASDKSLVTATVQYPVSATPTRVDLAAFQKAYMTTSEQDQNNNNGNKKPTPPPPDADMIKLYEAENRALFWILITFLLILLILFAIFLCCIYCPCCWLYGHCYSKGVKSARSTETRVVERTFIDNKRPVARHSRKIYPNDDTEDPSSADRYGRDPEASYLQNNQRRPPRNGRREAWSGDDGGKGFSWRENNGRRYRGVDRPPTPHGKGRNIVPGKHGGGHVVRGPEADVSLEDWEFEPNHPRISDRADEIGPRWQHIQHSQQQQPVLPQPQTITVPVPVSIMPIPIQQQQQQVQQQMVQQQIPQGGRRVGYIGHSHPGDEEFVRRPAPGGGIMQEMELVERRGSGEAVTGGGTTQGAYGYGMTKTTTGEMERSQLPRHYPVEIGSRSAAQSLPPGDSRAQSHLTQPRKTRFFKTETGEVLQFDFEGDEVGKELLIKRYIDEQQAVARDNLQQHQFAIEDEGVEMSRGRRLGTPANHHHGTDGGGGGGRYEESGQPGQITTVDRPRAAVVTKRPQQSKRGLKEHHHQEIPELDEDDDDDEQDELIIQEEDEQLNKKKTTKAKSKAGGTSSRKLVKQEEFTIESEDKELRHKPSTRKHHNRPRDNKESSEKKQQKHLRSHSLSEDSGGDNYKSKSTSKSNSKSKSRSRSKSPTPSERRALRKSKSQSPRPPSPSSTSPPPPPTLEPEKSKSHHHHPVKPTLKRRQSIIEEREVEREKEVRKTKEHHRRHHRPTKEKDKYSERDSKDLSRSKHELQSESQSQTQSQQMSQKSAMVTEEVVAVVKDGKSKTTTSFKSQDDRDKEKVKKSPGIPIPLPDEQYSEKEKVSENFPSSIGNGNNTKNNNKDSRKNSHIRSGSEEEDDDSNSNQPDHHDSPRNRNSKNHSQHQHHYDRDRDGEQDKSKGQGSNNNNDLVDINIIPPSSAPMTDSSSSPKENENERVTSLPDTPEDNNNNHKRRVPPAIENVADGENVVSDSTSKGQHHHHQTAITTTTTTKSYEKSNSKRKEDDGEENSVQIQNEIGQAEQGSSILSNEGIPPHEEDDEDSGIGIVGTSHRNKMLEKKSVFTIAYDEVCQKTALQMRPDTASNNETEAELRL